MKFQYTLVNDFYLEIENFSYCILKIVSGKVFGTNKADL